MQRTTECNRLLSAKIGTVLDELIQHTQAMFNTIADCLDKCTKAEWITWAIITYKSKKHTKDTLEFIANTAFTEGILKFKEYAANKKLHDGDATIKTLANKFYRLQLLAGLTAEDRLNQKKSDYEAFVLYTQSQKKEDDLYLQKLNTAIEKLAPECKQIIVWRHKEGKTNEEIAKILGIEVKSAANKVCKCMQQLKAIIDSL